MRKKARFDHEKIVLMERVCKEVWSETVDRIFFISYDLEVEARRRMILHVMAAVAGGEQDVVELRRIALNGIGS